MAKALPQEVQDALRELDGIDALLLQKKAEFDEELLRVGKALEEHRLQFGRQENSAKKQQAEAERAVAAIEERQRQSLALSEERRAHAETTINALIHNKTEGFELVARAWADYELAVAEADAEHLAERTPPAERAAYLVRQKGLQLAATRRRAKLNEWIVALYESHFPWLEELRSFDEEQAFVAEQSEEGDADDPVRRWISAAEWKSLDPVTRNQQALERYVRSRKSPWQLGRDYERYVGYLRERDGFKVTYHGIIHGYEDLGRDVLAEKDGCIEVIQCKRWARHKEIHEKHVFQLFGTMTAARIEHPDKTVSGTFTTTTKLSERARKFAEVLNIQIEESFPLSDYPRIKCNISHRDGERIYHLPFDQQYDATVIEPGTDERYATTCAEAEQHGFRRAWRWRANSTGTE